MGTSSINLVSKDGKRISAVMPSFMPTSNPIRTAEVVNGSQPCRRSSDFGILEEQSLGGYANNRTNPISAQLTAFNQGGGRGGSDFRFASLAKVPNNIGSSSTFLATYENRRDSVSSPRTDTSSDADTDERIQQLDMVQSVSSDRSKGDKVSDQKSLRRLAQNREAARKSRLRKKAYVQQLESSRLKLTQLEQELQKARQQGIFISSSGSDQSHATSGNGGALAFDAEYTRWLEEQNRQINELRAAINSHASDNELCTVVDTVITHFEDVFRLKSNGVKSDVFHILSGMWKTPAERCFMWIGGFRPSELLKLLAGQLEPLTEQQLMGIYNLQQSSQQAEEALSQGMDALQQSLSETLANGSQSSGSNGNVANYMGQMAMAMGKLGTLEGFALQADNLRQHTLQQMHRVLTTRQSARALLTIHDYFSRLRALSSLWITRPRE